MIQFRHGPNDKIIELGGGANPAFRPNVDVRYCENQQGQQTVDFTADFNEPLPIKSQEWDGVYDCFVIEHLSWRKVRQFISEIYRILKPGGKAVTITANTESQMKWIQDHPNGWGGKDSFDSNSCVLFGDQDYPENTHRNYLSPSIATKLFQDAGFRSILIRPFGEASTDMLIEAVRPPEDTSVASDRTIVADAVQDASNPSSQGGGDIGNLDPRPVADASGHDKFTRQELFDRDYFDGGRKVGGYVGGYWDHPVHEVTAHKILEKKPTSVLELGCARGYILKRIQDVGVDGAGLEISRHAWMTRVADPIRLCDVCIDWPINEQFDLCYSIAFFEHIPEEFLAFILNNLVLSCRRGLHGITFASGADPNDRTQCTLRTREWWRELFDRHGLRSHDIVSKAEMEQGTIPDVVLKGDGKIKLNLGSFITMFHHGWMNVDQHDLTQWASQNGYQFMRHDLSKGIPFQTGTVDLIMACHFLEHFNYQDGKTLLRECRRVLKSDGLMRIIVPDAYKLMWEYVEGHNYSGVTHLSDYDHISGGAAQAETRLQKLWEVLYGTDHRCLYDHPTLEKTLQACGFEAGLGKFREMTMNHPGLKQIFKETQDLLPCLSLYMNATPKV